MFDSVSVIKARMDKIQIERFASCLADISKKKCPYDEKEQKIKTKEKLILVAEDRYNMMGEDYDYIDTIIESIFKGIDTTDSIREETIVGRQMSLI